MNREGVETVPLMTTELSTGAWETLELGWAQGVHGFLRLCYCVCVGGVGWGGVGGTLAEHFRGPSVPVSPEQAVGFGQ